MSLLMTESFDVFAGTASDYLAKWSSQVNNAFNGTALFNTVSGRYGSGTGIRMGLSLSSSGGSGGNSYLLGGLGTDYTTLFMGFAFAPVTVSAGNPPFRTLDSAGTIQIDFRLTGANVPYLTRNGTTLCTAGRALSTSVWVYVEIALNISATAGWCELWLDGMLQASYYGTGTTRATSNGNTVGGLAAGVRSVQFGIVNNNSFTQDQWFDDFYICNSLGTRNNGLLGDVHVSALLPTGASADGSGAHTQFSHGGTSPSATNYQSVDDPTYNQDVDYVYDNVVGHIDTYQYADLPASATTVAGVVAQFVAKRDDAGMRQVQAAVRASGTDAFSPTAANLGASYQSAQLPMDINPVTGLPWTVADVNGSEFGYRISV